MKNKFIILTLIIGILIQQNSSHAGIADPLVDHTFNLQGELTNGNVVLNGLYDMRIQGHTSDSGLGLIGNLFEITKVPVVDGIFTINNVDLGNINDGRVVYLQISVSENGSGAPYEDLFPRIKINSVPYANQLITGNAQEGQILSVVGGEWVPSDLSAIPGASPWVITGSEISYNSGNVGIGIANPTSPLHVSTNNSLVAQFDGGIDSLITIREEGVARASLGSGSNVADTDFAIQSILGDLHLISGLLNEPSISIETDGDVGINTISPLADLHVEGTTGGDLFRVRIDEASKLTVKDNGGTTIGGYNLPPDNGLRVQGDIKQSNNSNGVMKYMVSIANCGSVNVSAGKSYNGINATPITVVNDNSLGIATCQITFGSNISNRFIMAHITTGIAEIGRSVSCAHANDFSVNCVVVDETGTDTTGSFDLFIF